jgi:hypothetical protein
MTPLARHCFLFIMTTRSRSQLFIVGSHRTGSTLWHNIIAMCPGIMRLTETRFLGPARKKDFAYFLRTQIGELSNDHSIERMVELCFSKNGLPGLEGAFWRFENIEAANDPQLKRQIARRIKESDRSLGAIARILIEEIVRFSGCERACVKFPVDVGHIPELLQWFPDCKIIHITRDPRAVAMSKMNDPSGTAIKVSRHPRLAWLIRKLSVGFVIAQYRQAARVHRQFQHLSNYRLFRYEDLLAEPEETLKNLCQFIEVDFTEELLHPEKGIHKHQPSSLTGKQTKAFEASAAVRWHDVIPALDKWLITVLTKRSMRMLRYDSATYPIVPVNRRPLISLRTRPA